MTSCKITTVKMTRECPVSFLAPTVSASYLRPPGHDFGCPHGTNFDSNKKAEPKLRRSHHGAPERTRTSDARFRKPTLYPLSYGGGYLDFVARYA